MNALFGVAVGAGMVVGGALGFRHAEALAGDRTRPHAGGVAGTRDDGVAMAVALHRGVALASALLGVATLLLSLA